MLPLSLTALARAFSRCLTAEAGSPERLVADAMRAHPAQVGGHGHDVTRFMQGVPGLLVKDGAEGVYAAALADGRAIAFKVDDGSSRARPPLLAAALASLGVEAPVLDQYAELTLLGGGEPVGPSASHPSSSPDASMYPRPTRFSGTSVRDAVQQQAGAPAVTGSASAAAASGVQQPASAEVLMLSAKNVGESASTV